MANKRKTVYCCAECGNETSNWAGRCPACGAWNTLQEVTIEPGSGKKSAVNARAAAGKAKPLSELDTSELSHCAFLVQFLEMNKKKVVTWIYV